MSRAPLLSLAIALAAAGCERTPPEELPAHPSAASGPSATAAVTRSPPSRVSPSRCVLPTPAAPPPAVAPGPAAACPPDPEPRLPKLPVVEVSFPDAGGVKVQAELVRSEHDTMRGLMYRTSLASDHGMLFDLRSREDHEFWMHNTCIPLDLIFIDADGLIVGIVEDAPTLDDTSRGVGCPSRYVLEVNAGWSRAHGVKAGTMVAIPEGHTSLKVPGL